MADFHVVEEPSVGLPHTKGVPTERHRLCIDHRMPPPRIQAEISYGKPLSIYLWCRFLGVVFEYELDLDASYERKPIRVEYLSSSEDFVE
jgi:hypothetical protein